MARSAATYVYCLLRAEGRPELDGAPRGLAGTGPPRVLAIGDQRWLIVADAPLERYSSEAIERGLGDLDWVGARAVEHEDLVEHMLAAGTVLPMKLFTLYLEDERAIADVLAREAEIDALLRALDGKHEWGVRLLVDPARLAQLELDPGQHEQGGEELSEGRAFLLQKQRQRDARRTRRQRLRARADELYEELARLASDARARDRVTAEARLLLDASFLVQQARTNEFTAAVRQRSSDLATDGLELVLSGPWPPYNFVDLAS